MSSVSQIAVLEKPMSIRSKQKSKHKDERMICTVCLKPGAIRYLYPERKQLIYVHRDEPPIGERIYRGSKLKVYRRCSATIKDESLQSLIERPIFQSKITTKSKPKPKIAIKTKSQNKTEKRKLKSKEPTPTRPINSIFSNETLMLRELAIASANRDREKHDPNSKPYIYAIFARVR